MCAEFCLPRAHVFNPNLCFTLLSSVSQPNVTLGHYLEIAVMQTRLPMKSSARCINFFKVKARPKFGSEHRQKCLQEPSCLRAPQGNDSLRRSNSIIFSFFSSEFVFLPTSTDEINVSYLFCLSSNSKAPGTLWICSWVTVGLDAR